MHTGIIRGWLIGLLALAWAARLGAVDIPLGALKMPDGTVLEQATAINANAAGVNVRHAGGVVFITYRQLPPAMRAKLGYDPAAEKAWYDAIAQRKAAEVAAKKAEEDKEQRIEARTKREKEIVDFQKKLNEMWDDSDGCGTGFFITSDGYLLTNSHVIADSARLKGSRIKIVWLDQIMDAKVVAHDPEVDMAVVKAELPEGKSVPSLPLSRLEYSPMGTKVFTVGFPSPDLHGWTPKLVDGTISSIRGLRGDPQSYQLLLPLHPGNSGGPLVNFETGEVLGITTAVLSERASLAYTGQSANGISYAKKIHLAGPLLKGIKDFPFDKVRKIDGNPIERNAIITYTRDCAVTILYRLPPRPIGAPID